jgi:hypothetical protein
MSDPIRKEHLAGLIVDTLSVTKRPLLAREIAEGISRETGVRVSRKEVNGCLYGRTLQDRVIQDADYRWSLLESQSTPLKSQGTATSTLSLDTQILTKPEAAKGPAGASASKGESPREIRASRDGNHSISVERVQKELVCGFAEAKVSGPCFFHINSLAGRLDIVLNTAHPVSDGIEGMLATPDNENHNPALKTLKVLLKAWAKLEDEAEGQRRQDLEDARLDWGRIARDLLQEGND